MAVMTIQEAADHFGVSKEAIHNRVRRGSLTVTLVDGIKYVDVDAPANKPTNRTKPTSRRTATAKNTHDERYYKLLEEQNSQLQSKVEKLEDETRSLRDQKEDMLIREREKIEQIYKEKDEQLKSILSSLSAQFMLNAPQTQEEEHVEAEIEVPKIEKKEKKSKKGELISLKKYLKKYNYSEKKQEKIKKRFAKNEKKDERIIVLGNKYYLDTVKHDYSDLIH